jgi:hypothetical protein
MIFERKDESVLMVLRERVPLAYNTTVVLHDKSRC